MCAFLSKIKKMLHHHEKTTTKKNLSQKRKVYYSYFSLLYCFYLSLLSQERAWNKCWAVHKQCCKPLVKKKRWQLHEKNKEKDQKHLNKKCTSQAPATWIKFCTWEKTTSIFSAANIIQALWWKLLYSLFHSHMYPFPIGNNILGKSFNLVKLEHSWHFFMLKAWQYDSSVFNMTRSLNSSCITTTRLYHCKVVFQNY